MDADTAAEFEKLSDLVDGYTYPPLPNYDTGSWSVNSGNGNYGTDVKLINSAESGPDVVLVGGQHGIEPAGWRTVEELMPLGITAGRVKYIPRADPTAINASTYSGDQGDMNDQWETGNGTNISWPVTSNLWGEISTNLSSIDDFVFDLHSSQGIYSNDTGVGQCIFPHPDYRTLAQNMCDKINNAVDFSQYGPDHEFTVGNDQNGSNNHLPHKVAGDSPAGTFLIETTREGTTLDERIAWTRSLVQWTMEELGIEFEEPAPLDA